MSRLLTITAPPRSGQFINGVLYNVANYLREEGRLLK